MGVSKRYLRTPVSAQTTATVVRHVPSRIFDCQNACTHDRTNARKLQEKLATGLEPLRVNTPTYGEMEARLKQNKIHQLLLS